MSHRSDKKGAWLRLTDKVLKQERRQALQRGRDSVAAGDPSAEEPQASDPIQTNSQPIKKARGASHSPEVKLEAPTKRPIPSQAPSPADTIQPLKTCKDPITECHVPSKRSKPPQTSWKELESPPAEENNDDDDDKDTCPLLYFYENLQKLRELHALPQMERMDQ